MEHGKQRVSYGELVHDRVNRRAVDVVVKPIETTTTKQI